MLSPCGASLAVTEGNLKSLLIAFSVSKSVCTTPEVANLDQDFPLGKSLLYGCYTAWKTKSILNEYTTIGAAKNLSTVVKVSLPLEYINAYMQNPLSDEAKYTEELLASVENLHAGKSCYAVIPSDVS